MYNTKLNAVINKLLVSNFKFVIYHDVPNIGMDLLDFNDTSDFWHDEINAYVLPLTQKKVTYLEWAKLEEKPASKYQLDTRVRTIIED
jgi:hypothetical protein